MRKILLITAAFALAACTPPAPSAPEAPEAPPTSTVTACNTLSPDSTKRVAVQDEVVAALPAASLEGGPITPGTYDLVSAVRSGGATGWDSERAAVLEVAESDAGVVLNWSSAAAHGPRDTWTATLVDNSEQAQLSYTCGRMGEVDTSFSATPTSLDLRVEDGGGALRMAFERRAS